MISVLIVHYNRPDLLRECLDTLQDAQDIVVVDNGSLSSEEQSAFKAEHPSTRWVFLDNNQGFSAGVNHAARAARGDVFLLLNPDTCWCGESFSDLEAHYKEREAGILGLRQVDSEGQTQLSVGWDATIGAEGFRKILQDGLDARSPWAKKALSYAQGGAKKISWVAGSALVTSRELFESLSGFDESYFLYFEDIDFCLRAREQGAAVIFTAEFSLMHHRGACASTVKSEAKRHYRESQKLFFKRHGIGAARYLLPLWGQLRKLINP